MTWYYVQNGERKGPVEQTEFEALLREGSIGTDTLVWQEGMADWRPCAEVVAPTESTTPTVAAPQVVLGVTRVACSRCGQMLGADQVIHLGGKAICVDCKPLVLQGLQENVPLVAGGAEQVRKTHLRHETSVKSVFLLYLLGGLVFLMAGLTLPFSSRQGVPSAGGPVLGLVMCAIGALLIWTGVGLRTLRPWSRVVSGILAGLGLFAFPLGTLINAYILYLLFSAKGTMVFSESYQQVIAATPHIKSRISLLVWILLGILLLLLVVGFLGILGSRYFER